MIQVSRDFSDSVFEDGLHAHIDADHPCHCFVQHQTAVDCPAFQLPEPFSGRFSDLDLVVMGQNPGLNPDEYYPVAGTWNFEEYDEYFRRRFDLRAADGCPIVHTLNGRDNQPGLDLTELATVTPRYWKNCEAFGREVVPWFRLGKQALIIQAIRYKSKDMRWCGQTARDAIALHEAGLTKRLFKDLRPLVVIASGSGALKCLDDLFRLTPVPNGLFRDDLGIEFRATDLGFRVVAVPHFTAQFPSTRMTPELRTELAATVRRASPLSPGPASAAMARAICASPTPIPPRIAARRSGAWMGG